MTYQRIEFHVPAEYFDVEYDTIEHHDDYEFWGERMTYSKQEIVNAYATISVPKGWLVDEVTNAEDLAAGDAKVGSVIVDVPKDHAKGDTVGEWVDSLLDSLPIEWEIVDVLGPVQEGDK